MIDYLKKNRLRIIIILLFIFFFFMYTYQTDIRIENWFSKTIQVVSYPFQQVYQSTFLYIQDIFEHYIYLVNVKKENIELKKKIKELSIQNDLYIEAYHSYQRLTKSLEFKKINQDKKVIAQVIAEEKQGYSQVLVINKGSSDGIRKNYAVITSEGIVGKIQSTTWFQSKVQLISDPRSKFPVRIQRTRHKAMLVGSDTGKIFVDLIPRLISLKKQDRIITSGLAGIFPKGTFVGTLTNFEKKEYGLFQKATLIPAVDFLKLEEVFVILESKENIHKPLFTE